jgi:Ferritin-like domain
MAGKRITLGAILAVAMLIAGCGGGGEGGTSGQSDKDADVELLNGVLSRQLGAVEAYERTLAGLRGPDETLARQFRAQEQEHAEAILKVLRALGGEADAEPEEIDLPEMSDRADRLGFLYELEGVTIDYELSIVTRLTEAWPRSLLASIVANQAQHRLLLRQRLGQRGTEAIPEAFEDGSELTLVPPTGKG